MQPLLVRPHRNLPSSGLGTVWTFSIVYRNKTAGYAEKTPYVVGQVGLEGRVKLLTNILTPTPESVTFSDEIELTFAKAKNGQAIPLFRVVDR